MNYEGLMKEQVTAISSRYFMELNFLVRGAKKSSSFEARGEK